MKRRKSRRHWVLPVITILLIGAGAVMPWAAARFQDLYGISAQEVLPFDAVSLTLRSGSETGSVLRLMSNMYDATEWPGETRMTEEEACMAAFDALREMDEFGLLEKGFWGPYDYVEKDWVEILESLKKSQAYGAYPQLVIALDGSSSIIWYCAWDGIDGPSYVLMVDDATGKAVTAHLPCAYREGRGAVAERIELWQKFFLLHYGFEVQSVREIPYDAGDSHEFLYILDPEDGLGECALFVYLYDNTMGFYPSDAYNALEAYGFPEVYLPAFPVPPGPDEDAELKTEFKFYVSSQSTP